MTLTDATITVKNIDLYVEYETEMHGDFMHIELVGVYLDEESDEPVNLLPLIGNYQEQYIKQEIADRLGE